MSQVPTHPQSWTRKDVSRQGRALSSAACESGLPPASRAAIQRYSRYISEQQNAGNFKTDKKKVRTFQSTKGEVLKNLRQNRQETKDGFSPVKIDDSDPQDPNKVSFRRKSKVDLKPRMLAGPDKEDTRVVREATHHGLVANSLRVLTGKPSAGKKYIREQVYGMPGDPYELWTQAQMSIQANEYGKTSKSPQWASGRQDPSTDAQRTAKGNRHARWERMTQLMNKKGHVPYDQFAGATDVTPTTITPSPENGFAYQPGNAVAKGERDFRKLHVIQRWPDRNGNPDHHFTGSNIGRANRPAGYDPGEDEQEYDQGRAANQELLQQIYNIMQMMSKNYKVNEEKMEQFKEDIAEMLEKYTPKAKVKKLIEDLEFERDLEKLGDDDTKVNYINVIRTSDLYREDE